MGNLELDFLKWWVKENPEPTPEQLYNLISWGHGFTKNTDNLWNEEKPHPPSTVKSVLKLPPKPFEVEIPRLIKAVSGQQIVAVLFGDTHIPFEDKNAVALTLSIISDAKPDFVVHTGDLVDCWQISRFDKDPNRLDRLQDNIDESRKLLHQISQIAPSSKKYLLEGNHEARLRKLIWRLEGAFRELPRLDIIQENLTWPKLLGLAEIGWEFLSEEVQTKTPILPKLITKHGTVIRKWSGWSAKAEWEKYGRSGVSGHSHRLGLFKHRDANGVATWIETGCTCQLDPHYGFGSDFDWQQGCVVLTWSKDYKLLNVEMVSFRGNRAIWRDKEYKV